MEISIRRARSEEISLLCKLDLAIFGSKDAFDSSDLWEGLEKFLITINGLIMGSIAMRHDTDVAKNYEADYVARTGSMYIVSTGIIPEWRGKGIGKIAKAFEIEYGRDHCFDRIVTNIRVSNKRSINLNQKFGFKIIQTIPDWYGDEAAEVLELKLSCKYEVPRL